jgi:pimeloyl-ACP methyl ester carboxylesterase
MKTPPNVCANACLTTFHTPPPTAATPAPKPSIVLVHGALIDGSAWRGVYDVLVRDGYPVSVVQQPLTGLDDDVAATKRVLQQQTGPVVLVGHSYGGAIITVAGADPKVQALVYVAALVPEVGETAGQAAPPKPERRGDFIATPDGFVTLRPEKFAEELGADLPRKQADFMAHAQVPTAVRAFDGRVDVAAWHDKPSYYILATEDHALDPAAAERMAQRAGAKLTRVRAGHAVLITQPRAVARVIEAAARQTGASP